MADRNSFRQLYHELAAAPGQTARHILRSWVDPARALLDPLRPFGEWEAHTQIYGRGDDKADDYILPALWKFYALSRVSDILLLPYQKGTYDGSSWPGPSIGPEERVDFFTALGLTPIDRPDFHPFYHEIVTADVAGHASPTVVDEFWPGFMFDHMLFCRAGVRIRSGAAVILKDVAEHSTLYWAYRRKNRPVDDLSQGWGSNSQWGTAFRRDYTDGHTYVYNADGSLDARLPDPRRRPNPIRDDLSPDERIELLVHRCFVRTRRPHNDLFPYHDTLTISPNTRADYV